METQKDYLNTQVPRTLNARPEAPRNIYDLADKQQQVTDFTLGDESGLTPTMNVPDDRIPQIRQSEAPRNRFVDKMEDQFDLERADAQLLEGADAHDNEPKVEQHPEGQPQPDAESGKTHHGSLKIAGFARSVLKSTKHDIRHIGRVINYDDGINQVARH